MSVLEKLIDQSLIAIEVGDGETGLRFSNATVSVYNFITGDRDVG